MAEGIVVAVMPFGHARDFCVRQNSPAQLKRGTV